MRKKNININLRPTAEECIHKSDTSHKQPWVSETSGYHGVGMLSVQGCTLERCTTGQVGSIESEHQGSKTASLRDTS